MELFMNFHDSSLTARDICDPQNTIGIEAHKVRKKKSIIATLTGNMDFRSSSFITGHPDSSKAAIWFEAHNSGGEYTLVKQFGKLVKAKVPLHGDPSSNHSDWQATIATTQVVRAAQNATEALEAVFKLESEMFDNPELKIFDIGDKPFGSTKHYIVLREAQILPPFSIPEKTVKSAKSFVTDLEVRGLCDGEDIPLSILNAAHTALALYRKPPAEAPRPRSNPSARSDRGAPILRL
jgi:hypothetical protein